MVSHPKNLCTCYILWYCGTPISSASWNWSSITPPLYIFCQFKFPYKYQWYMVKPIHWDSFAFYRVSIIWYWIFSGNGVEEEITTSQYVPQKTERYCLKHIRNLIGSFLLAELVVVKIISIDFLWKNIIKYFITFVSQLIHSPL